MEFFSLNWCIIIILCTHFSESARTLQIFGGSLTEITCSASVPVFRLVKEEMVYDSYDPDMFDIEATRSGKVATLYINGTNRSNNVTVTCRNIDASTGQIEFKTLFTVTLEFTNVLPAPNNVQSIEDPTGHLQILWEPPTLTDELDSQNVSIDSRITHYIVYIITNESTMIYNVPGTNITIGIGKIPCSFLFQVAAVNPAGVGERSPPQIIGCDFTITSIIMHATTLHEEVQYNNTICVYVYADPRFDTTQVPFSGMVRESDKTSLLDWAISSTTIAVLLAIVCVIILAACSFMLLKMYHNGMNGDSKNTEKEIEMKQNEVYGISSRPL